MPYDTITELDQLINRVLSYNPDADVDLVRRAYAFSAKAHEGQTRRSGEPYLQHPLAVAGILTSLRSDVTAIVAALLHDTVEDTLATYAPLANRLGIGWMKNELEDLCLKYLKPDVFAGLKLRVAKRDEERQRYIEEVIRLVKLALAEAGLVGEVKGRPKHLYGIYQKMERQAISFEEVYDLAAVRIITDTKMNCYAILGLIHSLWRPVPGRFKDYIAIPKSNLYQSLHTTVVGLKGEHVECQIRTEDMHRVAEQGIAAHWTYKEHGQIDETEKRAFSWLRQFVEWHQDLTDNRQFMDSVKLDLFHDVVYVFTPKGMVKEMPLGSTPVDFAYAIHTEIGDHCVGAKVDGKIVPLKHQLASGT